MKTHLRGALMAALALMAGAALAPGAAHAGDAACLWNAQSAADHDAFTDAFVRTYPDLKDLPEPTVLTGVCGVTEATRPAAVDAFASFGIRKGVAAVLKRDNSVDEAALLKAWNAVAPAERARFTASMLDPDAKASDADMALTKALAGEVGIKDDAGLSLVRVYLYAMAMQGAAEAKF